MTGEQKTQGHPLFHTPIVPYIREAGFAVRRPWCTPERRLLDYLFLYIQEGQCHVRVEEVTYHCKAGDFCLIQPNDRLTLEGITDTITPFAHMDIFYQPTREQSFPTRPGQLDLSAFRHLLQPRLNDCTGIHIPVKFVPAQPAVFRDTLLKMIGVWEQGDIVSLLEAQQAATELVLMLLKQQHFPHRQGLQEPQSLNWITSYLSLHLAEPLSVAAMARRAHLSPSRFSAIFRQHFGMPPHRYLLHLRIQHAQELLRTRSLTLQQIASYCGFADVHHFAKAFKRLTGKTPRRVGENYVSDNITSLPENLAGEN